MRKSHYIWPTLNIFEGRSDIILICKVVCSVYQRANLSFNNWKLNINVSRTGMSDDVES